MVYQYVVSLKNQHNRYIDLVGIILSIFSVACFSLEFIKSLQSNYVSLAYPLGIVFVVGVVIWNLYHSRKGKVYYSRALLIAALVWMKMPYFQWLVFVFIALGLLEYQAKYAIEIGFSDKEVVINSLFKKRYDWSAFTNIVLKDNLITLDFTNNRMLQREVEDDDEPEAEEDEFNEYCQQRLAASNKLCESRVGNK